MIREESYGVAKSSAHNKNYFLGSKDSKVVIQFQESSISTDAFIVDHVMDYTIIEYKSKESL